jgi:L-lactate utilization protein LutB
LLLHLRGEISIQQKTRHRKEQLAFKLWAAIMLRPRVYEATAAAARVLQRWFKPPLKAWTNGRDLRPIEEESFRERWRRTH